MGPAWCECNQCGHWFEEAEDLGFCAICGAELCEGHEVVDEVDDEGGLGAEEEAAAAPAA